MAASYLLDTTILLHWTRDSRQAAAIDEHFELTSSPFRPLVCVVSLGELRAFARRFNWGERRRTALAKVERGVVRVDISDDSVLESYAELSTLARTSGWGLFQKKNDLWIGASARATESHLLTMDKDFSPLRGRAEWQVTLLDASTGRPLP